MEYERCERELEAIAEAIEKRQTDQYHGETTPDHLHNIKYELSRIADAIETLSTVIATKKS